MIFVCISYVRSNIRSSLDTPSVAFFRGPVDTDTYPVSVSEAFRAILDGDSYEVRLVLPGRSPAYLTLYQSSGTPNQRDPVYVLPFRSSSFASRPYEVQTLQPSGNYRSSGPSFSQPSAAHSERGRLPLTPTTRVIRRVRLLADVGVHTPVEGAASNQDPSPDEEAPPQFVAPQPNVEVVSPLRNVVRASDFSASFAAALRATLSPIRIENIPSDDSTPSALDSTPDTEEA